MKPLAACILLENISIIPGVVLIQAKWAILILQIFCGCFFISAGAKAKLCPKRH